MFKWKKDRAVCIVKDLKENVLAQWNDVTANTTYITGFSELRRIDTNEGSVAIFHVDRQEFISEYLKQSIK